MYFSFEIFWSEASGSHVGRVILAQSPFGSIDFCSVDFGYASGSNVFDVFISILAYSPCLFFLYIISGAFWSLVETKNSPSNARKIECVSFVFVGSVLIGVTFGGVVFVVNKTTAVKATKNNQIIFSILFFFNGPVLALPKTTKSYHRHLK